MPYNEFEEHDMILYESFPFMFLLGCGLQSSRSVPVNRVRHLMF